MSEHFISEPIKPVTATMDASRMSAGEPGLPKQFVWRGETLTLTCILRHCRETGPCRHGSSQMYLRKHWYEVEAQTGTILKIYFEKSAKLPRRSTGWWLFSLKEKYLEAAD